MNEQGDGKFFQRQVNCATARYRLGQSFRAFETYCGSCLRPLDGSYLHTFPACACDHTPFGAIVSTRAWTQYQWDGIGDGGTPEEHSSIVMVFSSQAEADAHYAAHPLKPGDRWQSAETRTDLVSKNKVQRVCIASIIWHTERAAWVWADPSANGRKVYRPEFLKSLETRYTPEWDDGTAFDGIRRSDDTVDGLALPVMSEAQLQAYHNLIAARTAARLPNQATATYTRALYAERIAGQVWQRVCAGDTLEAQLPHFPNAWRRLCAAVDEANADASVSAIAERRAASEAWDSMLALVPAEQWGRLADIADACGIQRTSIEELEEICNRPESLTDVHLIRIPGGPVAFEAQYRQEAGFFTIMPRTDKGVDVFSIRWRMPLVEITPGQFAPDPRSTVHFVQVENCL